MNIKIREHDVRDLESYARIPIAFEVSSVLDVAENLAAARSFLLTERRLATPYLKDYDAIPGNSPTDWPRRFDMSQWRMFIAEIQGQQFGGAIVAWRTAELTILEGRDDLAVLWDLRVIPAARGQGVGAALFQTAENWAKGCGYRQLRIETQNINVSASRFYEQQGCELISVKPKMYPELPNEIQMIWQRDFEGSRPQALRWLRASHANPDTD